MLTHIIVICVILLGLAFFAELLLEKYETDTYWYYTFQHVIGWILHVLPDIIFFCLVLKLIIWILISI